MTLPKPTPTTDCCGAPIRTWHSQGDARADEGTCRDCDAELCSHCAAVFEQEDGYGDDGTHVRTFALCHPCHDAKQAEETLRSARIPEPDPDKAHDDPQPLSLEDRDFQDVPNGD